MTAPVLASVGTQYASSANGTAAGVVPAATQVGDLLIALIGARESGAVTSPTGWTELDNTYNATAVAHLVVAWKYAEAGDAGATYLWTMTAAKSATAEILRITGAHPTAPIDVAQFANQGSGTSVTSVAGTTTGPDRLVLHGATYQQALNSITPDAATTEVADFGLTTNTSARQWVAQEDQAAAGAIASRTATAGGSITTRKFILAIAPAVAASPPMPRRGARQIPLLVR